MKNWKNYHDKLRNRPARPLLKEALSFCSKGKALDIGAGSLNEAKYLADIGFFVTAVDPYISEEIEEKGIEIVRKPVDQYIFPKETYSLIISFFTLPFVSKNQIVDVVGKIKSSLKSEGVFAGQFFGPNDAWKDREYVTTYTRGEIQDFLKDYEILKFIEEEGMKGSAFEGEKYWHIFHVIARKR